VALPHLLCLVPDRGIEVLQQVWLGLLCTALLQLFAPLRLAQPGLGGAYVIAVLRRHVERFSCFGCDRGKPQVSPKGFQTVGFTSPALPSRSQNVLWRVLITGSIWHRSVTSHDPYIELSRLRATTDAKVARLGCLPDWLSDGTVRASPSYHAHRPPFRASLNGLSSVPAVKMVPPYSYESVTIRIRGIKKASRGGAGLLVAWPVLPPPAGINR